MDPLLNGIGDLGDGCMTQVRLRYFGALFVSVFTNKISQAFS